MKAIISFSICLTILTSFLSSSARVIDSEGKTKYIGRFVFDTVPMNLKELADSADRVFTGTCTDINDIPKDKMANLHVVKYTFEINESFKGLNGRRLISFKQWAPTTVDAGYEIDKKYVLFLNPNSKIGLTSPVGFLQGHFDINLDENNREVVANRVSNIGLHKNLTSKEKVSFHDHELYNRIEKNSEEGNFIDYKDFIKSVREVIKK